MTDGTHVYFGSPKAPDYIGDYNDAFQVGRQMALQRGAAPGGNDQGGMGAAVGGGSAGNVMDHIAAMSDAQRQAGAQAVEKFAAILTGLRGATPDPRQRLAMAQHIAQQNPQMGIRPEDITLDDVSDAGIASHVARAMSLQGALATRNPVGPGPGNTPMNPAAPRNYGAQAQNTLAAHPGAPSASPGAAPAEVHQMTDAQLKAALGI